MPHEFEFLEPGELRDAELTLALVEKCPANPELDWVAYYEFEMRHAESGTPLGEIRLRIDQNEKIYYGGQIGYTVDPKHRGHHYAARSVTLLLPFAKRHGLTELWITCNPDNFASRRSCEIAGGEMIEIVELPEHDPQYAQGERQKCRYRFQL
jgi:tagatose 1,6-diphosphate aldolase